MAIDPHFLERVEQAFQRHNATFEQKKMMGGMAFMVGGKMCLAVNTDKNSGENRLMARIGKAAYPTALQQKGVREMDFTGRVMPGYIHVFPEGTDRDEDLDKWVGMALVFNAEQLKKES